MENRIGRIFKTSVKKVGEGLGAVILPSSQRQKTTRAIFSSRFLSGCVPCHSSMPLSPLFTFPWIACVCKLRGSLNEEDLPFVHRFALSTGKEQWHNVHQSPTTKIWTLCSCICVKQGEKTHIYTNVPQRKQHRPNTTAYTYQPSSPASFLSYE